MLFRSGLWSSEATYYWNQFRWEWLLAIPAVFPVKPWLEGFLTERQKHGSRICEGLLTWCPKALALLLLFYSVVRLLSSTFRSFLYFQF